MPSDHPRSRRPLLRRHDVADDPAAIHRPVVGHVLRQRLQEVRTDRRVLEGREHPLRMVKAGTTAFITYNVVMPDVLDTQRDEKTSC